MESKQFKLIKKFSALLLNWYDQEDLRDMPWVGIKNPYHIWLSEIILQQTRVEQGRAYYMKFVQAFPRIQDLAVANEDEVLKLWQGLGYYSRARNLHETSKYISDELNGIFPNEFHQLIKLKGVGSYTAAAIASFAFEEPIAVVDGNVIRVISRVFGIDIAFDSNEGKKYFQKFAQSLISEKMIAKYNQAIMNFGALVCKPSKPLCFGCPFAINCFAKNNDSVSELPIKGKKIIKRDRFFVFLIQIKRGKVVIVKRKEKDIWKGLYQFPAIEIDMEEYFQSIENCSFKMNNNEMEIMGIPFKQTLTHQKIHALFVLSKDQKNFEVGTLNISINELNNFAFPKIIDTFIKENKIFEIY